MPSYRHEALVELFRHRPRLAAELLSEAFKLEVPAFARAGLDSGELTDLAPTEYRADAVVRLTGSDGDPVLAVVVEAQLRTDRVKRRSWPVYLATVHARLRCPAALLVVCADHRTAGWCARPIELGPGSVVTPWVLGPDRVPVVIDAGQAGRSPELAVLSAMAHAGHPDRERVFEAFLAGLKSVDLDQAGLYADAVLAVLPEAARRELEALMATRTYEYQSEFARKYFFQGKAEGEAEGKAEGKAEGEARAVLAFLAARGVKVPEEARTRISGCRDLEQLETWVRRAATATTVEDLFD